MSNMTTREYSRRWRKKQEELGKCPSCGRQKNEGRSLCEECLSEVRDAAFVRYRVMNNIPLDAPRSNRGRPRGPRK